MSATHVLDRLHLGARSDPAQTTDPAIWQPYSILAPGGGPWFHGQWIFGSNNASAPTVRIGIGGLFRLPVNYVQTPVLLIDWSATLTSGDVVWDFDYLAVATGESIDQTAVEALTVTSTAPGATDQIRQATLTLNGALLSAGDLIAWALYRDGVDAADTMAGAAQLHHLGLQFADG
jgi:hypothetical protein